MNFLAPAAFAFAALLPLVVLFYLLKRKRTVKLVSSTVLWQRFLAETQASAPFQKLRKNWLLLLQLLVLALAVVALARPYFAAQMRPAELRVVILDGSASMLATDVAPNRFEKARSEALTWVNSLSGNDQMVVLLAGAHTEVKQSATSEKAALRRALQQCAAADAPTRLVPALRMAESLVRDKPGAEIHLFSDGCAPGLEEFEHKALPLIYHRVGAGGENVGITALDVRANPENPQQRAVYARVANYSTNAQARELELRFGARLLETRPLNIPAGEVSPQIFLHEQREDGVYTLWLNGKDALVSDDTATLVSLLPKPARVLLVSPGNALLERALRAALNVDLTVAPQLGGSAAGFDFVVLDGVAPAVWPAGNVLAIKVAGPAWLGEVQDLEGPPIVDWRSTHPLMRYAGLENVQIVRSMGAKTPPWAVSLVDAPQASLVLAGELGRQRIVWVGFDLLESNWPLRISFPIFIANCVEWLNPANSQASQLMVKAGEAFRLPLAEPVEKAEVTSPDGRNSVVPVEAGAPELVFGETHAQGAYRLRVGTNDLTFCVNLLDANESDIAPRGELALGKFTRVEATTMKRANMELWRSLVAVGLLLLLFEWWYYHRRTV